LVTAGNGAESPELGTEVESRLVLKAFRSEIVRKRKINRGVCMKIRSGLFLAAIVLFGTVSFAQDNPKLEVSLDYSYVHANPQNNNAVPAFSLNGGGGSVAYYFTKYIGIQGDLQGYGSNTHSFTLPATSPYCLNDGSPCPVSAQGNLFTYNVGPVFKYRTKHFEPFAEALFGGAHSNFYGNLYQSCGGTCTSISTSPSNNAFDFIVGGGLDIPITSKIAIRPAQIDYLLTRFGNAFTGGNNNQSNLRYQAGIVFRL
jgi:opacity protein-like surface antigen